MSVLYESNVDFIKLSREYPGKWVALHPDTGEVLASGSSPKEVMDEVPSIPGSDPVIVKVEEHYGAFVT